MQDPGFLSSRKQGKRIFVNFVTSLFVALLLISCSLQAQEQTPPPARVSYDLQSLVASRSGPEMEGRKLFSQRCALCHIGAATEVPFGGWLNGQRIATIGEDVARQRIMESSPGMPGWKHTLQPSQIDNIIAYLKTVKTNKKIEKSP